VRRIYGNKVLFLTFSAIFLAGGINYAAAAPTNTSLPSITGEATVGTSLTVNTGSWSSTQITFNIQWFSCPTNLSTSCVAQSGRTTGTYLITTSDLTKHIRASVTALDATGGSTVFTSLVGPVVTPPQASVLPVITGVATPGSVLQAPEELGSGAAATGDHTMVEMYLGDTSNCTVISLAQYTTQFKIVILVLGWL